MHAYSWAVVVLGFLFATLAGTPVVRGMFRLVDWQTRREAMRREAIEIGEGGQAGQSREGAARGPLDRSP